MTTVLDVPEMSCGHCKVTVEKALLEVDGVATATVDLEAKTAAVEHDDGVSDQVLAAAVGAAGYSVTGVQR